MSCDRGQLSSRHNSYGGVGGVGVGWVGFVFCCGGKSRKLDEEDGSWKLPRGG